MVSNIIKANSSKKKLEENTATNIDVISSENHSGLKQENDNLTETSAVTRCRRDMRRQK